MTKRMRQPNWLFRAVGLWIACTLALPAAPLQFASAQSTEDAWEVPTNLSHSGAATKPIIFADSTSILHAVWQDEFSNFVAAKLEDNAWSAPVTTNLQLLFGAQDPPAATSQDNSSRFTGPNPLFLAGDRPYIYAIWLTAEGKLYASRALSRDFTRFAAWTQRKLISSAASSFTAAFDAKGVLHLAYFQSAGSGSKPAGLYYTRFIRFGADWTTPALLDGSPYYRGLVGSEANLSLATAGTPEAPLVYLAWDNRPRKQLLLTRSVDSGATWEQPLRVAGPAPDAGQAGPYNIRVGASESQAVLIWQNGAPMSACSQFYQYSVDAGASWSEAQLMFEDQSSCPQANDFVGGPAAAPSGWLYLLTHIKNQTFLSAWNGTQWSMPQEQRQLVGFQEPEIFTEVAFGCHYAAWYRERLYVVGCDAGQGGDIWVTSRDVAAAAAWFVAPIWNQPQPVSSESLAMASLEMTATGDDLVHAFFSQYEDTAIYYLRWDGARWSRIAPILRVPDGDAGWPAVAAGPGNKLILVTRSSAGALYYSRSTSSNALTASGWSAPVRLPIAPDGKVSPADVVWDAAGIITIVYSKPVNERRGVFILRSKDEGRTWSEPIQVFDGVAANVELVGPPTIAAASGGSLHVLWDQQSIGSDGKLQPLALYYAHSVDKALSFSEAEVVIEAPVAWREIVVDGRGQLHRFWQQANAKAMLWDQVSRDGGQTWQTAQRLPAEDGIATVIADSKGQLQLVSVGIRSLSHWLWDGSRWQTQAPLRWLLAAQQEAPVALVSAAVNTDGDLVVGLALLTEPAGSAQTLLVFATRALGQRASQAAVAGRHNQPALVAEDGLLPPLNGHVPDSLPASDTGAMTVDENQQQPKGGASRPDHNNEGLGWAWLSLPVLCLLAWRVLRSSGR